jgi:hypothetical protein
MNLVRFAVGRWLVHLGIAIMPDGRPRRELRQLLIAWGIKVKAIVAAHKATMSS